MGTTNTKPQAVIFDFDGTFCDIRPILHHIDRSDVHLSVFHEATHHAPHNENVFGLLDDVQAAGITPILVSVRGERWREVTEKWLADKGFVPEFFHMRDDEDRRAHAEVKREIIRSVCEEWNVLAAIDDDPKNIAMFTEEGIRPILVPGYDNIGDPKDMVVPEWWGEIVRPETAAPAPATALPAPERARFARTGATCQLPVKSAGGAPCRLRTPHRGSCRSR